VAKNLHRQGIIDSIRQSLAAGIGLPQAEAAPVPDRTGPADRPLAQQFQAELEAVGGLFASTPAAQAVPHVVSLVQARGATAVLAWDDASLALPGLRAALAAAGIRVLDGIVPSAEPARAEALRAIEAVTVGVTGVDAAWADTGTLALRSGPGRPRLASLSVRTHIALLPHERLYPSWAAWLAAQGRGAAESLRGASSLTLITGPSRTADIEMTLTIGVHGPREVIVVCLT
jgi:L-lactate dehydrogenase complex protein LldG